uniref:restriction endonuclease subunit S n=1 Tax=Chamaesiphon sp. GL140_3_metabinner_50 TaxID=2970812 RepID=UPI0025E16624
MIPDGWKRKSLGEIADISSGSTPLRQKDEYWNEGTIPWVTTGEIDYQIIESAKEKITELALKECSLKIYDRGTILMAMYGQGITRGRIALLGINATTNQACCAISVDSIADTKFIYFQLEHLYQEIRKLGHGGNQQNLNGQIIKQIPIMFPPLSEQCKIAEILGVWDEPIDLLEKLIGRVRSRKQGLMQQLLTGKKRFKEFEGSEWNKYKQSQIAHFYNGRAYKLSEWEEYGTPVIRLQNLTGTGKNFYYSNLELPEYQYVNSGDLLYMWSATFGPHIWQGEKAIYHYHIWKVVCDDNLLSKNFFYFLLDFETQQKMSKSNGMGILHITKFTMESTQVILPSLPEQEKIAAVLSAADEEISTLEKQ